MQEVCILFWFFICSSRVVAILYYIYTTKIVIIVIPSLCAGRGTQKKKLVCVIVLFSCLWAMISDLTVPLFLWLLTSAGARRECEQLRTSEPPWAGRARTVCGELESTQYICQRRKRRFWAVISERTSCTMQLTSFPFRSTRVLCFSNQSICLRRKNLLRRIRNHACDF